MLSTFLSSMTKRSGRSNGAGLFYFRLRLLLVPSPRWGDAAMFKGGHHHRPWEADRASETDRWEAIRSDLRVERLDVHPEHRGGLLYG